MEIKKLLISTLVFPKFDYVNLAYCDLNEQSLNKLQRAQNACIRYIFNLQIDDHVTPFYHQMKWLKIRERLEFRILCFTYKMFLSKKPDYLFEKYVTMHTVHSRQTRFGQITLQFPIFRTMFYSNSFHVRSIRLLNILEADIRSAPSERTFKSKLKNKLLNKYNT